MAVVEVQRHVELRRVSRADPALYPFVRTPVPHLHASGRSGSRHRSLAVGTVAVAHGFMDILQQMHLPLAEHTIRLFFVDLKIGRLSFRKYGPGRAVYHGQFGRIFLHAEVFQPNGHRKVEYPSVLAVNPPLGLSFADVHHIAFHVRRTESSGQQDDPQSGMVQIKGVIPKTEGRQTAHKEHSQGEERQQVNQYESPRGGHLFETESFRFRGNRARRNLRDKPHDNTQYHESTDQGYGHRHTREPARERTSPSQPEQCHNEQDRSRCDQADGESQQTEVESPGHDLQQPAHRHHRRDDSDAFPVSPRILPHLFPFFFHD